MRGVAGSRGSRRRPSADRPERGAAAAGGTCSSASTSPSCSRRRPARCPSPWVLRARRDCVAERLEQWDERFPRLAGGAAGQDGVAAGVQLTGEPRCKTALADPGLTYDRGEADAASGERGSARDEAGERGCPPDERRRVALGMQPRGSGGCGPCCDPPARSSAARSREALDGIRPSSRRNRARKRSRRRAPTPSPRLRRARSSARDAPPRRTGRVGAPARPGECLFCLAACLRDRREGDAATPAMAVALPQHPVVVQLRQQITAGELERRLGLPGVEEPVDCGGRQRRPRSARPARGRRGARRRPGRAPGEAPKAPSAGSRGRSCRARRARARPRTADAGMRPRVQREPGQQGASGAAGRQRKLHPVEVELERAERAHAQRHGASVPRGPVAARLRCVCGRPGHSAHELRTDKGGHR